MSQPRSFQGIWIPADIWENRTLSIIEKVMLVEIQSLQSNDRGCYASNSYFAKFFDLSQSRVSEIIKGLAEKGLISVTLIRDGKQITERQIRLGDPFGKPKEGYSENAGTPIRKTEEGYSENTIENNTKSNNTKSSKETRAREISEDPDQHQGDERKRFPMNDDWAPSEKGWHAVARRCGIDQIDDDLLTDFKSFYIAKPDDHQTQAMWVHRLAQWHRKAKAKQEATKAKQKATGDYHAYDLKRQMALVRGL